MFYFFRLHASNAPPSRFSIWCSTKAVPEQRRANKSIRLAVLWPALLVNLYYSTMVLMPYYRSRKSKAIIFLVFFGWPCVRVTNAKIEVLPRQLPRGQGGNHPKRRRSETITKQRIGYGAFSWQRLLPWRSKP